MLKLPRLTTATCQNAARLLLRAVWPEPRQEGRFRVFPGAVPGAQEGPEQPWHCSVEMWMGRWWNMGWQENNSLITQEPCAKKFCGIVYWTCWIQFRPLAKTNNIIRETWCGSVG